MSQFPNVNPLPFSNAQLPLGLLGRSFGPQLPPIGGFTDADLERMMFALRQSGLDPGRLARIQEVQAMRSADRPADLESQLLRPTSGKRGVVGRTLDARQQLLDALSTRP